MNVFAIADLHLGFSTGKWMDGFGDHWKNHASKVAASWRDRVRPSDLVLLPGDFSWATRPQEVALDLQWLADLPGRKVMIKGNHDFWWPKSQARLESLLPDGVFAIKKRAAVIDGVAVIGARGCDFEPFGETTQEEVDQALEREERELRASIDHLRTIGGATRPPIAMFHYPPFPIGSRESRFTRILEEAGCRFCVFGHLHHPEEWTRVFQGQHGSIEYRLVACDAVGFAPVLIERTDAH